MKIKLVISVLTLSLYLILTLNAQPVELNKSPCLYEGVIEPSSGTARTHYTASVHYYDPDGKKPSKIVVYVDDVSYNLKKATGKANNGIYKCKLVLPPGGHKYYFYAEDDYGKDVRYPKYGMKTGPVVSITKPWIEPAKLSNGGLIQKTGTEKTVYTFTVNYYDPNDKPPKKIYVIVDNIKFPMNLHKGKPANGIYLAMVTLPAGPHAYYFKALDARGNCLTLPEQGFIRGPDVVPVINNPPKLLDAKIEPTIGYSSTSFTYYVTYRDEDFDPPSIINIVIDGVSYPLKLKAGSKYNGLYFYRTKHYLGNLHNYYFYCEDGRGGNCRIPAVGAFHGPVVVK
ncbi:MAG: hypothetical protein ABIK33_04540 [candidate division WOR-3 bacterium]